MAAMFEIVGAICMGLAEDFVLLAIGRVLIGFGVGSALMIAPLYAAELAPMRPVVEINLLVITENLLEDTDGLTSGGGWGGGGGAIHQ